MRAARRSGARARTLLGGLLLGACSLSSDLEDLAGAGPGGAAPSSVDGSAGSLLAGRDGGRAGEGGAGGAGGAADAGGGSPGDATAGAAGAGLVDGGDAALPPPTCADGARNGAEEGVDCGGPVCPRCGLRVTGGLRSVSRGELQTASRRIAGASFRTGSGGCVGSRCVVGGFSR